MRSGISAGWEGEAPCRRGFGFDNWEAPHSASETSLKLGRRPHAVIQNKTQPVKNEAGQEHIRFPESVCFISR